MKHRIYHIGKLLLLCPLVVSLSLFLPIPGTFIHGMEGKKRHKEITPLVHCLAKEEESIHLSKTTGPIVELNREFLSHFASTNKVFLKRNYFHRICRSQAPFSPSLSLLQVILMHGQGAFEPLAIKHPTYSNTQNLTFDDLQRKSGRLLLNYLSGVQGLTLQENCLENKINSLYNIHQKYQDIEKHVKIEQLIPPSEVLDIFKQLKNLDKIIESCGGKKNLPI